jgi:transposase InsO family protein
MRRTAAEKLAIIELVEASDLSARRTLREIGISQSTFYNWYRRYLDGGLDGLTDQKPVARRKWNRIPDEVRAKVVDLALKRTELSAREIAWSFTDEQGYFVSESSTYRLLKSMGLVTSPAYILLQAGDVFEHPTRRVHELWQLDFTYLRIVGWGWYYLLTVMDDFSRYVVTWRLGQTMCARDVTATLEQALEVSGLDEMPEMKRPRVLSDNGSAFVSGELREFLEARDIRHTRGAPYHPMTQGKIERYHRSMKNVVKLEHYFFPSQLEEAIGRWVSHYNDHRYHESLHNVRPVDVYLGRHHEIHAARRRTKRLTLERRRRENPAVRAA